MGCWAREWSILLEAVPDDDIAITPFEHDVVSPMVILWGQAVEGVRAPTFIASDNGGDGPEKVLLDYKELMLVYLRTRRRLI